MTWNKTAARSNGGGSGTATAPTRTPVTVRNVVAEAAQESALRRQEIQALLEEYARKQEGSAAAPSSGGAATAATPAPAPTPVSAPKPAPTVTPAAPRPAAAKTGAPMTPASIDRRLQSLETAITRIEAKISGGVRGDKVEEIATIVEDLLVKVRSLRG